jgi:type IV pilus assembly protein PilA
MFDRIKTRLASEEGFTLIELLVVIIILGILIAIAVPAYLSLTGGAHQAAAQSNVRSAIPAAESFYESNGTYTGLSCAGASACGSGSALAAQAPGVSVTDVTVSADGAAYCIDATNGSTSAYYIGGNQTASTGFGALAATAKIATNTAGATATCADAAVGATDGS